VPAGCRCISMSECVSSDAAGHVEVHVLGLPAHERICTSSCVKPYRQYLYGVLRTPSESPSYLGTSYWVRERASVLSLRLWWTVALLVQDRIGLGSANRGLGADGQDKRGGSMASYTTGQPQQWYSTTSTLAMPSHQHHACMIFRQFAGECNQATLSFAVFAQPSAHMPNFCLSQQRKHRLYCPV
jgi:hypothetical protein